MCNSKFHKLFYLILLVTSSLPSEHNGPRQWVDSFVIPTAHAEVERETTNLTIALVGRKDAGISSTIRELIGSSTTCLEPASSESFLREFFITNVPSEDGPFNLRLIDVPGWLDGRSLQDDARSLASLKSYIETSGIPDFFIAVSGFDEHQIEGINSLFVQSIKRLDLFHETFLDKIGLDSQTSDTLHLLTRLMTETKLNQRKPERKIQLFRNVIENYSQARHPIQITVGDNDAVTEYEVPVVNGYARLPNKQLYPRNVWEGLKNLTKDEIILNMLESLIENRQVKFNCEVKAIKSENENPSVDDDTVAFNYLMGIENQTVLENEVNRQLEQVYGNSTRESQTKDVVQKLALQLRLQQENYFNIDDLSNLTSYDDRATFFENNDLYSAHIPAYYLNRVFDLEMPEYNLSLITGQGYYVPSLEMVNATAFQSNISTTNSIGFQLPNFMQCRQLPTQGVHEFKSYSISARDYMRERLKYLNFVSKYRVNASSLEVSMKDGFNLKTEANSSQAALSVVQEHRTIECNLVDSSHWMLTKEFLYEVDSLFPLDRHDKESVAEWQSFFRKWGTHVISKSYCGGSIHGNLVGPNMTVFTSRTRVVSLLNSILRFNNLSNENMGVPKYRVFGGDVDSRSDNINIMGERERSNLLSLWQTSLRSHFTSLDGELDLIPISDLVRGKISHERAAIVDNALDLLLLGRLTWIEKKPETEWIREVSRQIEIKRQQQSELFRRQQEEADQQHRAKMESIQAEQWNGCEGLNWLRCAVGRTVGVSTNHLPNPENTVHNVTHQIWEFNQEQLNAKIRSLETALRQHNETDTEYAVVSEELEIVKTEWNRRLDQEFKKMLAGILKVSQINREYYQRQSLQLQAQMDVIELEERNLQERKQMEEEERMEIEMSQRELELERAAAEEEEQRRRSDRCKGWNWLNCQVKMMGIVHGLRSD